MESHGRRDRVLVAGGSFAGLEATLALHHLLSERIDLVMLTPRGELTYRPLAVEEPFTMRPPERRALGPILEELGYRLERDAIARVLPDERAIETAAGKRLEYDGLIVCVGGRMRSPYERAATISAPGEEIDIDATLLSAGELADERIALIVPPGSTWPLPIYEIALLAERRARELGRREARIAIFTHEPAPLSLFGQVPSDAVAELLERRGIEVHTNVRVIEEEGELYAIPDRTRIEAGIVIALPEVDGPALEGLPSDERGFIPIDEHCRVPGLERVYAAGDATAFPVKQGGLATQQADAAAEHLAAELGAEVQPQPFQPVLRGQLIAGAESLHLRQALTGGHGEGDISPDYLWWPPQKVAGRFLAPFLGGEALGAGSRLAEGSLIDVEVPLEGQQGGEDP
jgi:sulfide:quinone oxidoreductase